MGILYKTFQAFRTVFCLAFLVMACAPAMAQDTASLYTVQNINVDVTAENAIKAREQAFEQAQVKAFEELAGRLLDQGTFSTFAAPQAQTISTMIQDYEVSEEKLSSKRYSGTYIFRFRRSAVERYFSLQSAPVQDFVEAPESGHGFEPDAMNQGGYVDAAVPETPYAYGDQSSRHGVYDGRYAVHVAFSSLAEWTKTQRALAGVYGVRDIALQALSPRDAYLEIVFQGDIQRLKTALAQAGLMLEAASVHPAASSAPVYELRMRSSGVEMGGVRKAVPADTGYQGRF